MFAYINYHLLKIEYKKENNKKNEVNSSENNVDVLPRIALMERDEFPPLEKKSLVCVCKQLKDMRKHAVDSLEFVLDIHFILFKKLHSHHLFYTSYR